MSLIPHPVARAALEGFRDEVFALYPELVCLVAYGSALGDEFVAEHSNVNLLLVLPRIDAAVLARGAETFRRYRKKHRILPLILSEQEIRDSVDVFAVEYLDIKERHIVLKGSDIFDALLIPGTWLRHQCEFELRGKLIRLRQGFLESDGKDKPLLALMTLVLSGVLPLGRSLLRLTGERAPHAAEELVAALSRRYQFDARSWQEILVHKRNPGSRPVRPAGEIYADFLASLTALVGSIDVAS